MALAALAAAAWLIPAAQAPERGHRRFDVPGALTVTAAMLLLVYTIVSAEQVGWASARTIGSFAAVAVLLAVFTAIEWRSPGTPLGLFGIFRSGVLQRANAGAITLFGTYVSFQFRVTQYLQSLNRWSALSTAFAFLSAGAIVAVLSTRMSPDHRPIWPGPAHRDHLHLPGPRLCHVPARRARPD